VTRCRLNLTLTATKLPLKRQSASDNRGHTYQIRSNLRNHAPGSCHSGWCGSVTRACGTRLALLVVRRLFFFPAFDYFREWRERSHDGDRNPQSSAAPAALCP
jgi:hypothetical protein